MSKDKGFEFGSYNSLMLNGMGETMPLDFSRFECTNPFVYLTVVYTVQSFVQVIHLISCAYVSTVFNPIQITRLG